MSNNTKRNVWVAAGALAFALLLWAVLQWTTTPPSPVKVDNKVAEMQHELQRLERRLNTIEDAIKAREVTARDTAKKAVATMDPDSVAAGLNRLLDESRRGE